MAANGSPRPSARKPATRAIGPHVPPPYQPADISAFQALARGDADEAQQQRALRWVIEAAAGTYEFNYYRGESGERDTAFALGRAFVGQQIIKLLKIPPTA